MILTLGTASAQTQQSRLGLCIADVNSGNWENPNRGHACKQHYDLPSPWLLKCLSFEYHNYENSLEKDRELNQEACHIYFKESPERAFRSDYSDYDLGVDMPKELRRLFYVLKRAFTLKTDF